MRTWYVARTKPHQEIQTSVVLGHRGVDTYFPLITPRRRRRAAGQPEPLFPGYLFVSLDTESTDWVVARSAPGISYFLGGEGLPTAVPDALVEEIRQRVTRQDYDRRQPSFHEGDRVVIVDGPFEGVEAIFDDTLSPAGRSRVLVSIVSRLVPVQVNADHLRARS